MDKVCAAFRQARRRRQVRLKTPPDARDNPAAAGRTAVAFDHARCVLYDPVTGLVASYTDSTGTTSITYGIGRAVTRITHLDGTYQTFLTVTQVGQNGDASRVTTYTYTPAPTAPGQAPGGLVATMTDPRGIETEYGYTSFGAISSIVFAAGTSSQASISLTYDANENPASYTNELGQTTLFVYDGSDRKIAEQDPPPDPNQPTVRPIWNWFYDARGNLLTQTDPLNRLTSYVYATGGAKSVLDQMIQPDPAGGTNYTITTYDHL